MLVYVLKSALNQLLHISLLTWGLILDDHVECVSSIVSWVLLVNRNLLRDSFNLLLHFDFLFLSEFA